MNSTSHISIARVIARLNVGGPAIQAILMTEVLRQKGYRTLLLSGEVPPEEASMDYLARANNVTPVTICGMSRRISLFRDIQALWMLIRIFRRESPTIVHTHTAKAGTLGRLAAIITGIPIRVHTFHGHVFSGYFSPPVTRAFMIIERVLARFTDCIVAISESQCKELVEVYRIAPASKVATIRLGFDLQPFLSLGGHNGALRREIGCRPEQPLVGWIGRLTAIKSPGAFIECAAPFRNHSRPPGFVMVGDGDLRQECETRINRNGLGGIVHLMGWRRDLPAIYADLDLVVATSLNEGTPVVLLEAMASAKAIVSTAVGGVRDLMVGTGRNLNGMEVFENGILVGGDTGKLVQAVEYLMQNPDLCRSMGCKGRDFVASRFSHFRLADDLGELYQSLAQTKLRSRYAVVSPQVG